MWKMQNFLNWIAGKHGITDFYSRNQHFYNAVKSCPYHRWIQTKIIVRKRTIRVKIGDFLSRMTLKFDEWPWKTLGHLFYATSSFVHHFVAIGEFKLE